MLDAVLASCCVRCFVLDAVLAAVLLLCLLLGFAAVLSLL
jgi:hypothetical protein